MGYVSLKTSLQTDQVLAVAYEYTSGGVTYQVGEFASDLSDTKQALFVKSLKNTSNNPRQGNWELMMKNVYYLASAGREGEVPPGRKVSRAIPPAYISVISLSSR